MRDHGSGPPEVHHHQWSDTQRLAAGLAHRRSGGRRADHRRTPDRRGCGLSRPGPPPRGAAGRAGARRGAARGVGEAAVSHVEERVRQLRLADDADGGGQLVTEASASLRLVTGLLKDRGYTAAHGARLHAAAADLIRMTAWGAFDVNDVCADAGFEGGFTRRTPHPTSLSAPTCWRSGLLPPPTPAGQVTPSPWSLLRWRQCAAGPRPGSRPCCTAAVPAPARTWVTPGAGTTSAAPRTAWTRLPADTTTPSGCTGLTAVSCAVSPEAPISTAASLPGQNRRSQRPLLSFPVTAFAPRPCSWRARPMRSCGGTTWNARAQPPGKPRAGPESGRRW